MTSTREITPTSTTEPSSTSTTTTQRPRNTRQGHRLNVKGTAHLGIQIDLGREPSAARAAHGAAKIHTATAAAISEGWSPC